MNILLLGAAGQISQMLIDRLLAETSHSLVLYGRNISRRIKISEPQRETIFDGDFSEKNKLILAMTGVDVVYLNDMNSPEVTEEIILTMKEAGVSWIIGANILGIYDEVAGAFGEWNKRMVGNTSTERHRKAADILEGSGLDYVNLRLTWLYDQEGNESYQVSQKGEPFIGAQISRQAVVRLIMGILADKEKYKNTSLGVSEPDTNWGKPSFY